MPEQIADLIMNRSETLQMTYRLETPHHLLSYSRWLVGVFRPVV
jgi:hypothetical protein